MTPFKRSQLQKGILNNVKDHINHMLKDENISEGQFEYFIAIHENEGINQNEFLYEFILEKSWKRTLTSLELNEW